MRAELEARRHSIEDEGDDLDTEVDTTSILANLWFDFNREGKFKPYVGFGLGASEVDPGGASETLSTWQLGGGINWQLAPSWVMDMGYRYFETEDGEYEDDGAELEQEHGGNIFKLGINYLFNPAKPANLDDDGDGVVNNSDQCPNTPLGTQVDPTTGCEPDNDRDGVVNSADSCPNTPPGTKVLSNGCAPGDDWVLEGVNFESDSVVFVSGSTSILDKAVRLLQANPSAVIEVQGHTDSRGSDWYNEQLSERRANRVREYLIENGISADRLTARGYGESEPTADNDTVSGRAANRRVALSIVSR